MSKITYCKDCGDDEGEEYIHTIIGVYCDPCWSDRHEDYYEAEILRLRADIAALSGGIIENFMS
jgi:hypothetical protein